MSSEYQELLEKLLNSDTTDVIPQSRAEHIMLTAINSLDIDTLPEPGSRMEAYLMALITKMGEGGSASSSGGSLIVTYNPDDPTKATHSASEIYEAFQSGKTVQFYNDGTSFRLIISSPYDATFAVSAVSDSESNAVVLLTIDINDSSEITIIGPALVPAISTTAEVGQTLVVKSVDENGHPTAWKAVDMATGEIEVQSGFELIDSIDWSTEDMAQASAAKEYTLNGVTEIIIVWQGMANETQTTSNLGVQLNGLNLRGCGTVPTSKAGSKLYGFSFYRCFEGVGTLVIKSPGANSANTVATNAQIPYSLFDITEKITKLGIFNNYTYVANTGITKIYVR